MMRTNLLIYHTHTFGNLSLSVREKGRTPSTRPGKNIRCRCMAKALKAPTHSRCLQISHSSKNYHAWHEQQQMSLPTSSRSPASSSSGPLSSNNLGGRPWLDYQCRETQRHRSGGAAEVGMYQHLCGRVVERRSV